MIPLLVALLSSRFWELTKSRTSTQCGAVCEKLQSFRKMRLKASRQTLFIYLQHLPAWSRLIFAPLQWDNILTSSSSLCLTPSSQRFVKLLLSVYVPCCESLKTPTWSLAGKSSLRPQMSGLILHSLDECDWREDCLPVKRAPIDDVIYY